MIFYKIRNTFSKKYYQCILLYIWLHNLIQLHTITYNYIQLQVITCDFEGIFYNCKDFSIKIFNKNKKYIDAKKFLI